MRVLFVTSEKGMRGGERQLALLAERIASRGGEVALCAPREAALHVGWRGPAFFAPMANALDVRGALAIRKAIGAFQPELIHVFTSRAHALARRVRGRRPLIVTRSVAFPADGAKYRSGVAAFVAVSKAVAEALGRAGVAPSRIHVIHPGVICFAAEREAGQRLRAEYGDAGRFVIAGVGALEPTKGFDLALRALAKVPGAALWILGQGPERARLLALAKELGVGERLRLFDAPDLVPTILGGADAFLSSSRLEGFGMALVEAMGVGLPCVVADSGGVRDIVSDGRDALRVARDDVAGLAGALARLRDEPALRSALGLRAAERARAFSPEVMAERTLAVYGKALQEEAGP